MGCSAVVALPTAVPWPPAATTVVAASVIAAPQNIASQLRELAQLKNAGALSEREYIAAKERVLGGDGAKGRRAPPAARTEAEIAAIRAARAAKRAFTGAPPPPHTNGREPQVLGGDDQQLKDGYYTLLSDYM